MPLDKDKKSLVLLAGAAEGIVVVEAVVAGAGAAAQGLPAEIELLAGLPPAGAADVAVGVKPHSCEDDEVVVQFEVVDGACWWYEEAEVLDEGPPRLRDAKASNPELTDGACTDGDVAVDGAGPLPNSDRMPALFLRALALELRLPPLDGLAEEAEKSRSKSPLLFPELGFAVAAGTADLCGCCGTAEGRGEERDDGGVGCPSDAGALLARLAAADEADGASDPNAPPRRSIAVGCC